MTAIPGPTESPAVQTARWVARPIRFLEDCRRRYGDTFEVTFQGFQTPLVMVSSPDVIRALYGERGHKMPPGRQITLKPLVGARSLLLLEGDEHLSRRKVMLPPFHGDRMRAYEPVMREITEHELDGWPEGRAFAVHPSMQAITLEVILRAVFGTRDERLRVLLRDLLAATTSMALQVSVMFGRRKPLERLHEMAKDIDGLLFAEIAQRRRAPGEDICSMLVAVGHGRSGDPRPADDAADRRSRDDRDRAGVVARPARPSPGRDGPCADRRRRVPARGRRPSRCGCARWCRWRAAASPST